MPNKSPLQIEFERQLQEFDKKFTKEIIVGSSLWIQHIDAVGKVKSFLTSSQQSIVKKMTEIVEGMKRPSMKEIDIDTTINVYGLKGGMSIAMKNGYNSALSDILSELNKTL